MSTVIAGKTFTARQSFALGDTDGSGCIFSCGGVTYYGMYSDNGRIWYADDNMMTTYTKAYEPYIWVEEVYKTITFDEGEEPISGDFETWFNAVYVEVSEEELYLVERSDLEDVADAIRAKSGTQSGLVFPSGFISDLNNIPTPISWMGSAIATLTYEKGE